MRTLLAIACLAGMAFRSALSETDDPGAAAPADEDLGREATIVSPPVPTTGVAGTRAVKPGDAGALDPANVPKVQPKSEGESLWVRFKQLAHIPPGRTVRAGEVAQIPADHLHPDLHEELDEDDPAIPGNEPKDAAAGSTQPSADDLWNERVEKLEARVQALEQDSTAKNTPASAPPADPPCDEPASPGTVDHVSV